MILIYAEKEKIGGEIAAALDKITLKDGTQVTFNQLGKYAKAVKNQQKEDLCLDITFKGKPCKVIWGSGHLCSLKRERDYNPSYASWKNLPLPFFPPMETKINENGEDWQKKKIKKLFDNAKRLFPKAEYIINATDDDREGELLFAYLYEHIGCKVPVKRIFISSNTKKGFCDAFDAPVDYSTRKNNVLAGKARSYADFYIGTNLTTALTLKNPGIGIVSCGRLQTTILNLIVSRENDIINFKPEDYYTVEGLMSITGEEYTAVHSADRIKDSTEAKRIHSITKGASTGKIKDVTKTSQLKAPPELYNLSGLQIDAASRLGFTMSKTLDVAQKLYEDGYTTYARTNSSYLNNDKKENIKSVLDMLEKTVPAYSVLLSGKPRVYNHPENYFDDSKVTSHFAIVPTGKPPKGLTGDEAALYDLIAKSVIRTIYPDAEISHTKVITEVNGEDFISKGTMVTKKGWMEVSGASKEKMLPTLVAGDTVEIKKIDLCAKKTNPPKRYTDVTLMKALISIGKDLDDKDLRKILLDPKHVGIGTDATRAATVKMLETRDYIKRVKGNIMPTEKGIQLIKLLPIEELKSAETTARWEKRLADIENGNDSFASFIDDTKNNVVKWLALIDSTATLSVATKAGGTAEAVGKCPLCGKDVIEHKWGCGCSGYKEGCKFSIGTIAEKKISTANVKKLLSKGKTGLIKGFTSKKGKKFDAYLVLDGKEIKFEFDK